MERYETVIIGGGQAGLSVGYHLQQRNRSFVILDASARIGDARSTYEDGVLTRVNPRAAAFGIAPGMSAREFVAIIRRASAEPGRN